MERSLLARHIRLLHEANASDLTSLREWCMRAAYPTHQPAGVPIVTLPQDDPPGESDAEFAARLAASGLLELVKACWPTDTAQHQ